MKDISHWPAEVRRWLDASRDDDLDAPDAVEQVARYWENLRDSVDAARARGASWADLALVTGLSEQTLRRAMRGDLRSSPTSRWRSDS